MGTDETEKVGHARTINRIYLDLVRAHVREMFSRAQDAAIDIQGNHYVETRHFDRLLRNMMEELEEATDPVGSDHKLVCRCQIPRRVWHLVRFDRD